MESLWSWRFLQAYGRWTALRDALVFFASRQERGAGSPHNGAASAATAAELKGQLAELRARRNQLVYLGG